MQVGVVCKTCIVIGIIALCSCLILFYKLSDPVPSCVCRNHLNQPVDWFIVYKLPRLSRSIDPFVRNGTGYIYLDSSSSLEKWQFSSQGIDSSSSMTGLTLDPLYKYPNQYSYMFYNDQPPNKPVSMIYGHSKGVLAFEDSTKTGFWLVHSVPRFPQIIAQGYGYPDSGKNFLFSSVCTRFIRLLLRSCIRSNDVMHNAQFIVVCTGRFD